MTIRSKVWLLVAVSLAVTTAAAVWLHTYALRRELNAQAREAAQDVAAEIADRLAALEPDSARQEAALVLQKSMEIRPRIQLLELFLEQTEAGALKIEAPRGDIAQMRLLSPSYRAPELIERLRRGEMDPDVYVVQQRVDLQGPHKAMLTLHWSLVTVGEMVALNTKLSLILGVAQLVALVLLTGFLVERTVLRRLDTLGRAMRDVEKGDLKRRVPVGSDDEVGRLSQGFNRMLEQLSAADREIRAFNQRLADEIEAATQDLSKKNLALEQLNRLLIDLRRENASRVRLAALGQLAAQLAHEIGTPLSSVSGHLQLALLQRDLPSPLRDRLDVATREIGRIGRIVRDYLDSTRSLEPERKETSLRRVLEEAVEVTGGVEHRDRPVTVTVQDVPGQFVTDPGLLRQVVINLLSNALDAVERGGHVTLAGHTVDDQVHITVSDTGSGIGPEDLRRIFEPFYTTKGRGKGTGLGLAICRELVAALGGTITVESAPGEGSTFTVRLPRRGPQGSEASRPLAAVGGAA